MVAQFEPGQAMVEKNTQKGKETKRVQFGSIKSFIWGDD